MLYKITGTDDCIFCVRAEAILKEQGHDIAKNILATPEQKRMFEAQGFKTVPQIYLGEVSEPNTLVWKHIGGYQDLIAHPIALRAIK